MEFTDLAKFIKGRHSIRSWQDKEVPEELLSQAVQLATWAPNAGNKQNWHFYIIINQDTIKTIADAVQASVDKIASWPEAEKFEAVAKQRQRASFFRSAPAAIVISAGQYQSPMDQILAVREETDPWARQVRQWRNLSDSRIQSTASAIAYLLLILPHLGLGAVWMTGPMQAKGEIEKILKVPADMDVIAFIPIGYPAESPTPKERRPVGEVSEIIR